MTEPKPPAVLSQLPEANLPAAGLSRRLAGLVYEALLLLGVLFISALPVVMLTQDLAETWRRPLLQLWELAVCGGYFVWQWRHTGQTLPMRTWRMRLVSAAGGGPLTTGQAMMRYLLACATLLPLGAGIAWAWFDRDRQFLYDRLAGTRVISTRGAR
jgi:uncharacterized RDD family membrane protein YckC